MYTCEFSSPGSSDEPSKDALKETILIYVSAIGSFEIKFSSVSHSCPLPYFVEVTSLYIIFIPDYRV